MDLPPVPADSEIAAPAVHAIGWAAPNPKLAAAMLGGVMHAQGQVGLLNPDRHKPTPWQSLDLDRWEREINAALKGESLTFDTVKQGVAMGHFQAWSLGKAIMLSELVVSPRMRALHVFAAAGDLAEIREMTPALEAFAVAIGCNLSGATGRKGWLRVLKPFGFAPARLLTLEKEL